MSPYTYIPSVVLLRPLPLASVAGERVLGSLDGALGLLARPAVAELVQPCRLRLGQVEPVHRLREPQVRVDARNHDARVDRDQLDPDHRNTHVRIDHETLVEDQVDDIRQPARTRRT